MREGFEEDFGRRGGQRVEEMHLKLEGRKNREENFRNSSVVYIVHYEVTCHTQFIHITICLYPVHIYTYIQSISNLYLIHIQY